MRLDLLGADVRVDFDNERFSVNFRVAKLEAPFRLPLSTIGTHFLQVDASMLQFFLQAAKFLSLHFHHLGDFFNRLQCFLDIGHGIYCRLPTAFIIGEMQTKALYSLLGVLSLGKLSFLKP